LISSAILNAYDPDIEITWADSIEDGSSIKDVPIELATLRGPVGIILSAERVLLNFLQRLCGVATLTRKYVNVVASTEATIFDTRKTTPGWRRMEKYAVRCGGGKNHRMGLYDAVLIKDNHLADIEENRTAPAVFELLNQLASSDTKPDFVEVEADTLTQVSELYKVIGVDVILLDNFSLDELRQAVQMRDELGLTGKIALEASGGITLDTVLSVAQTGVDRISVGALTHSAPSVDLSLERIE